MAAKRIKFYCKYDNGMCGIRIYSSAKQCEREELKEHGYAHFHGCRVATKEDIESVKSMGGYIGD